MVDIRTMLPKDCHENQTLLLSHAAECLAKAAITLSEAAEAIAAAAKAFVSDTTNTVSVSLTPEVAETNTGINAIVDYESDSDSSPISDNLATPRHTNNARTGLDENDEFKSWPTGEGSMTSTDEDEYLSAQSTLQREQSCDSLAATRQSPANRTPETETTTQLPPSYRILLCDEADVLLAVCCLIRQSRKTVCYLRSSITTLDVYKALLTVVEVPVHTIKSYSSQEVERVVKGFQDDYSSVLLLPATYPPSFRVDETDSLVVHVGWPTNQELYKQQITVHRAKNNVFVAYSGDEDIYPSSSSILMLTQPWPQDAQLFKNAYTALRPLFSKKLQEIPAKTKAKAYTDWIITHGVVGPYHPPSWTPSTLVYRANLYLLDVLGYHPGNPAAHSGVQIALPEVSAGFVASQKLESAVEEGILRVKSATGLNHIPSPYAGAMPAGTITLNEGPSKPIDSPSPTPAPAPAARPKGPNITTLDSKPQLNKASSNINIPNLAPTPSRSASRTSSNTDTDGVRTSTRQGDPLVSPRVAEYLITESEPDVIPLICHLSTQPDSKNVICFVKNLSVFVLLAKMLEQLFVKPIFSVKAIGQANSRPKNVKKALHSPTGCLILCNMYENLPTALRDIQIGWTIHLGWADNSTMCRSLLSSRLLL
ncbi:unnamed protein product [Rhizoctonia solani]|uniref:Uncharacterized protein n=1 Tax=Rhizoctonia solani TaxID=456999 RepID=A0A8H3D640_9AGAM|nr:unnamed protein product [Rhizoctonia solani]